LRIIKTRPPGCAASLTYVYSAMGLCDLAIGSLLSGTGVCVEGCAEAYQVASQPRRRQLLGKEGELAAEVG